MNNRDNLNKKKVGLLTSHACMNFGGLLQAYALQQTIKELGYDCNIINYIPDMHNIRENPLQFVLRRKNFIKKALFGLKNYNALQNRVAIIESFRSKYFSISPKNSVTYDTIQYEAEKYDVLCCGSDQLWNLSQNDNANRIYMFDFPHHVPSISYAVSFGDGLVTAKNQICDSLSLLRKFQVVSVREPVGQEFLSEHGISSCVSLDPTLLAEEHIWKPFLNKPIKIDEEYILVYGFENAHQRYEDLIVTAKEAAKMMNLPVINPVMTPKLAGAGFKNVFDCGPIEFINLIEHAALVCTNSFHGSIFSYLLQKPFVVVFGDKDHTESRKSNILKLLGQEYRGIIAGEKWNLSSMMDTENPSDNENLNKARIASREYLSNALYLCTQEKNI